MSYISPLEHIKEIEEELKEKGFVGKVLFDLLVCEGWGCGRYLEGVFDGNTFVTFEITYPQYPVDTFTLGFFKDNQECIYKGCLSEKELFILTEKIKVMQKS